MLDGIEAGRVEGDEARLRGERAPRAGGEVLKASPDREDDVRLRGERVGRGGPDDAHRADVHRVVVNEHPAPGHRLRDGDPAPRGKGGELRLRERVADPAPRDDEGAPGLREERGRRRDLVPVRARAGDGVDHRLEERLRVVERELLGILAQADEGGPAIGRVEHQRGRLGQRGDDLLGVGDPIPVAGDRAERVVDRRARGGEVLDLLKDRVGPAVREDVAGQDEDRQAVRVADGGRGHHVGGPRPDRRGRDHDLPAAARPGEAERGEGHGLLVLAAPGRKLVLHRLERLGETGHVAVPEDPEHARKEPFTTRLRLHPLVAQVANERLGHRESHRLRGHLSLLCRLSGNPGRGHPVRAPSFRAPAVQPGRASPAGPSSRGRGRTKTGPRMVRTTSPR